MNTYSGVVADGLGSRIAGVSITAGDVIVVTDTNGRYQFQSTETSLVVSALVPPNGYEGAYTGLGTITPGERNFITRRIIRFTIRPPATIPVSDGTNWYGVSPIADFDTGTTESLSGSRENNQRLTSSDSGILRIRSDSGRPVIEGVSPGTASVTGSYWGVSSASVAVQVVPR